MLKRIPVKAYAPPGTPCCCGSGRIGSILRGTAGSRVEPASDASPAADEAREDTPETEPTGDRRA